jgi:hypothetical protein
MKDTALGRIVESDHRAFPAGLDPGLKKRKKSAHRNPIVRGENCGRLSGRSFNGHSDTIRMVISLFRCPYFLQGSRQHVLAPKRPADTLARPEGDELLFLLPHSDVMQAENCDDIPTPDGWRHPAFGL